MNFLSNIFKDISTGATDLYNRASSAVSNFFSPPPTSGPLQGTLIPGSLEASKQNVAARVATDLAVAHNTPIPANQSYKTPSINLEAALGKPQTVVANQSRPSSATSNYTAPTDAYGRTSTASQGQTYTNSLGQIITPKVAFSGLTGEGSGQTFQSTPATGTAGTAGGSAYTGLLNAVGGAGQALPYSSALSTPSEEDKKKQAANAAQSGQPSTAPFNPFGNLFNSVFNANGTQTSTPMMGPSAYNPMTAFANSAANQTEPQAMPTTPASGTTNMGDVQATKENNSTYTNNSYATSTNDSVQSAAKKAADFNKLYTEETAKNPPDPNLITNTQEQADLINSSPDPFGMKQAMDSFIKSQTTLGDLQASRVDLMNQMNATKKIFEGTLDDIKKNPDLPKKLAGRRLEYEAERQKPAVDSLISQLNIVNQSIQDQNEMVNRQFQNVQFAANRSDFAANQAEKEKDNARQNLQLYISTGAIGAFTDKDIKSFASATGISSSVIKSMVTNSKDPNVKTEIVGDSTSGHYLVTYDSKTGKLLKKTQVAAPTAGVSAGGVNYLGNAAVSSDPSTSFIGQAALSLGNNIYSKDQRNFFLNNINGALSTGNVTEAKRQIMTQAYNKLSAQERDNYRLYDDAQGIAQSAAAMISDPNNKVSFGPYKSVKEFLKPFVGQEKDPNYVKARQAIELSQAQIRKGYYGTAVTSTEAGNANQFLISDNDDANTVALKLNGYSQFLKWVNDANLARSIGVAKPDINSYVQSSSAAPQQGKTLDLSGFNFKF